MAKCLKKTYTIFEKKYTIFETSAFVEMCQVRTCLAYIASVRC